jgi:hypothetical protein
MCRRRFIYDDHIFKAGQKIGNLVEAKMNTRTTDGHRWYASFTFKEGNSHVCILLPFIGGSVSPNHVDTPRHPAAYIKGSLDEEYVSTLLDKLERALDLVKQEENEMWSKKYKQKNG